MPLTLSGATGLAGLDGSASTPVVQGTDTNTGVFYPAADTVGLSTNGSERMRVDSAGNVGIGTTSPNALYKLTLSGVSGSNGMTIYNSGDANRGGAFVATGASNSGTFAVNTTASGYALTFGVDSTEKMRIDTAGNVGIGLSNPARRLHVYVNNAQQDAMVQVEQAGAGSPVLGFLKTSVYAWMTGLYTTDNSYRIAASGADLNTNPRLVIDTSGNLLVGTTSAGATVTVYHAGNQKSADFYAVGNASSTTVMSLRKGVNDATTANVYVQFLYNNGSTGAGQINGNGGSQAAFGSYSDVRLKENIQPLSGELEKVCSLRPVEFDYKDGNGHQIGFIAQEVQTIYPDVVSVGENEMLTVTGWNKTEARLVQAIKELTAKVTALEAKVGA